MVPLSAGAPYLFLGAGIREDNSSMDSDPFESPHFPIHSDRMNSELIRIHMSLMSIMNLAATSESDLSGVELLFNKAIMTIFEVCDSGKFRETTYPSC